MIILPIVLNSSLIIPLCHLTFNFTLNARGDWNCPWKFEYIWTARGCTFQWKASQWSLLSQTAADWCMTNSDRHWLVYGEFHTMKLSLKLEERMLFSVLPWQYKEDLSYYRSFSWAVEPIRIRNLQMAHLPSPLVTHW